MRTVLLSFRTNTAHCNTLYLVVYKYHFPSFDIVKHNSNVLSVALSSSFQYVKNELPQVLQHFVHDALRSRHVHGQQQGHAIVRGLHERLPKVVVARSCHTCTRSNSATYTFTYDSGPKTTQNKKHRASRVNMFSSSCTNTHKRTYSI